MRVALVTASSAGLGAAIAEHLVSDMRVVINYFSTPDRANGVLARLYSITAANHAVAQDPDTSESTPRFFAIRADLGERSEIQRLVSETIKVMGRLDLVVSNCGWTRIRNFAVLEDNVDEEDWDRCFNINVKSHLYLFHAAKEHLNATAGSFTTVASVAGVKPSGSSLVSPDCPSNTCPMTCIFVVLPNHLLSSRYPAFRCTRNLRDLLYIVANL